MRFLKKCASQSRRKEFIIKLKVQQLNSIISCSKNFHHPLPQPSINYRLRLTTTKLNRKGAINSPCLRPLDPKILLPCLPLTKMEKFAEHNSKSKLSTWYPKPLLFYIKLSLITLIYCFMDYAHLTHMTSFRHFTC